ncbi:MAG TPA: pseudouridine synthase [Candidatus Paceibacterota bacterium]
MIRINKYLRDKGLASRREADKLIEDGFVIVNKKKAIQGMMVDEGDEVVVRGKAKNYQYLAYYKPRGLSTQDKAGRENVVDQWKDRGLYPVGRLDKESEGLLVLTNDGRVSRDLLSEKYPKEYVVSVREKLRSGIPAILKSGMHTKTLGKLLPAESKIMGSHSIRIILHEGKKHQIRIMLSELKYTVVSLKRVAIGKIKLGNLQPGQTRTLSGEFLLR